MSGRPTALGDWNAVATSGEGQFRAAVRLLEDWGPVGRTDYYNVLVLRVADPSSFLEAFAARAGRDPWVLEVVGRVVPCHRTFDFQSREEFESRALEACLGWAPALEGASFHVRMRRRGFKRAMSSQEEERLLDEALLAALAARGAPGRILFDDPDAVVSVETVGGRAGLSLWTRRQMGQYPFLGVD